MPSNETTNTFDTFIKTPIKEVSNKTFISPPDIEAIFNKDFAHFNLTKARGFIHIIEREYDIDLSDWINEYNLFMNEGKSKKEEVFLIAEEDKEEEKERFAAKVTLPIIALIILTLILIISFNQNSDESNEIASAKVEKLKDAKAVLEEKKSVVTPKVESKKSVKTTKIVIDNTPIVTNKKTVSKIPSLQKREFYISANARVWMRITYLDNQKFVDKIISGEYDFDSTRDQEIQFGHGDFTLFLDDQTFTTNYPKATQRYRYEDGILTKTGK
jgi:hypothetical protein